MQGKTRRQTPNAVAQKAEKSFSRGYWCRWRPLLTFIHLSQHIYYKHTHTHTPSSRQTLLLCTACENSTGAKGNCFSSGSCFTSTIYSRSSYSGGGKRRGKRILSRVGKALDSQRFRDPPIQLFLKQTPREQTQPLKEYLNEVTLL